MCGEVCNGAEAAGVGVIRVDGEYRLLSVTAFRPGDFLFEIIGVTTDIPSRYSVQIDHETHIDLGDSHDLEEILDRYCWRFMNHSCEPNTNIHGRKVFALRPIRPWEEITFDYNTTEYDMAEPFQCRCESPECRRTIRGFRYLSFADRAHIRPWLAPHLLCLLEAGQDEPMAANPSVGGSPR